MQGDTALSEVVDVLLGEVPVHIGINQTEDNGFVAHQSLVVRLAIRDGLLVGTAVFHFPEDAADVDILVAHFLDGLDPVVGDVHRHAIVEAVTAILELSCKAGHAGHFLGNGDGVLVDLVNQAVSQRQVADGVVVLVTIEVVTIASEGLT